MVWQTIRKVMASLFTVQTVLSFSILVCFVFAGWAYVQSSYKAAKRAAWVEVEAIVAEQHRLGTIKARKPSDLLVKVAKRDPRFVAVCLGLTEARHWPGVTAEQSEYIIETAVRDSAEGFEALRWKLYYGVSHEMEKAGKKPSEDRIGWVNNNPATATIFLEWPIAERIGKKAEFVIRQLDGTYREEPFWHAPVTTQQMINWWWGKWPFKGEDAPLYQPDEGLETAKRQKLAPPVITIPQQEEKPKTSTFKSKIWA